VHVSKGNKTSVYVIVIRLEDDRPTLAQFKQNLGYVYDPDSPTAPNNNGNEWVIRYNLYIPSNIKSGEVLPVVYALHGSSGRWGPASDILRKWEQGNVWVKDSERGHNRAIVLVPQASDDLKTGANWYIIQPSYDVAFPGPNSILAPAGEGAHELLQLILAGDWATLEARNNAARSYTQVKGGNTGVATITGNDGHFLPPGVSGVKGDAKRVYVTGLSMGGGGTIASITAHPDTFAAALPVAGVIKLSPESIAAHPGIRQVAIKFVHGEEDPVVDYQIHLDSKAAILADGKFKDFSELVFPVGTFLYGNAHSTWVPVYRDQKIRDWVFSKSR
jgi:predicted peptidase